MVDHLEPYSMSFTSACSEMLSSATLRIFSFPPSRLWVMDKRILQLEARVFWSQTDFIFNEKEYI
jgi:hypothetical protein